MTPDSRKRRHSSTKPASIGWFDLPLEMREIVIDFMDPKTRCRFAQCSKTCDNEAKKSRNYLYEIGLIQNYENDDQMELHVYHGNSLQSGFLFEFFDIRDNQTSVVYRCYQASDSKIVAKWTKLENGKPEDVRLKYFNEYVEKYKHSIRSLVLNDDTKSVLEVDLKILKKLERIEFKRYKDDDGTLLEDGFVEQNQLMRFKHLDMPSMYFTFDQIFNFKGETLIGKAEEIDQKKINNLLKMVKNGKTLENIKHLQIFVGHGNMERVDNVALIVEGLDVRTEFARQYMEHCRSRRSNIVGCHLFYLPSEIRKNGRFLVTFVPLRMLEIKWITLP